MSEAPVGRRGPSGTLIRGRLVPGSICGTCHHGHERIDVDPHSGMEQTYTAKCDLDGCECAASGDSYSRGVTDASDVATFTPSHDYDDDSAYDGPRCLPERGERGRVRSLDTRGRVRRGWMDRLRGSRLSRLARDFGGELGSSRRWLC